MRKIVLTLAATFITISLASCGKNDEEHQQAVEFEEVSLSEFIDESSIPEVIATVNGEPIKKDIFVSSLENMINARGIKADDENAIKLINEMKEELIDRIIDERLLTQAADEKGIIVTEKEIDRKSVV